MTNLLEIKNLNVSVGNKKLLKNININIKKGEIHVLFGPNGSGKSTLVNTIVGIPKYKISSGKIIFNGKNITHYSIDKRIKIGLGIAFQHPPVVIGVKLNDILRLYKKDKVNKIIALLNFRDFLNRDINKGFSGGEIKKSEILQLIAMKPTLAILDEPDSGVDIESINVLGKEINKLLEKSSGLIITHLGHILNYVNADIGHVIINGGIVCTGNPKNIIKVINKHGFKRCEKCPKL